MSRSRTEKDITMDGNDAVKSPQVQPKSIASIFSSPSSTTTTINTQRMRNANEDGGVRGSGNRRNSSRINNQSSSASSSNAATSDEVRRSTTTSNVSAGIKRPFDSVDNSPVVSSSSHRDPTAIDQLQQLLGSDIGHFHAIRSPDSIHGITPSSHHHIINRGTASVVSERRYAMGKKTTINDNLHGQIIMEGLCKEIMDTREFQRLRSLNQLGVCNYVFPGAIHKRFEHSLGVAHCAEKLVRHLQNSQPDLDISEKDVLCVKVAGLCHDLGHGPFSHVYDGVFMTHVFAANDNDGSRHHNHWRHEDGSVKMLQHLVKANNINLDKYGLDDIDVLFIEEIIGGVEEANRKGRSKRKFYLYDIVNNNRSGLDVDKLDYFQRDMKNTNVSASISNFDRFISECRVCKVKTVTDGDQYMLCYPHKMAREVIAFFRLRAELHQAIYTHKTVKKVEYMLVDALMKADPFIRIQGSVAKGFENGEYKISECIQDSTALSNLNDGILYFIQSSCDQKLNEAKAIIERIHCRKFYNYLGRLLYHRGHVFDRRSHDDIKHEIVAIADEIMDQRDRMMDHSSSSSSSSSRKLQLDKIKEEDDDDGDEDDGHYDVAEVHSNKDYSNKELLMSQDSVTGYDPSAAPPARLQVDDIIIEKMHIHQGMKDKNPMMNVYFYRDIKRDNASVDDVVAEVLPESEFRSSLTQVFEDLFIRAFCKDSAKHEVANQAFEKFAIKHQG